MRTTHEKLEELEHRIKALKSDYESPALDMTPGEVQNLINNANMVRKLGYQIENAAKLLHLKLFGKSWDPDVVANPPLTVEITTPMQEDLESMKRDLGVDVFMAELADGEENLDDVL